MKKRRFLFTISLLILSCAKQGFPPGGPEDKTPPMVIHTFPEMGATQIDPFTDIEIRFNERIRPVSSRDVVFITPNPGKPIKLKWRSKGLKIKFSQPLEKDRTYVITLGTGIRDYRNNPMSMSYCLAFSTGDSLDQGSINGRVYSKDKTVGIGVWAYPLTEPVQPDPRIQEPEYIVQCNESGVFAFSHMAVQCYRLFAVRDRLNDRLYKPMEDEIGLTWTDIDLHQFPQNKGEPVWFRMTREDTLAPSIIRAIAPHSRLISVLFNEPVEITDSYLFDISISPGDSFQYTQTIKVVTFYQDSSEKQWFHFITESQPDNIKYSLTIHGIRDASGHGLESSGQSVTVTSTSLPDTSSPVLLSSLPNHHEQNVSLQPNMYLFFSESMDTCNWQTHITLHETGKEQIPLDIKAINPARFIFTPLYSLRSRASYQLILDSLLTDLNGNALRDTVLQFMTLHTDTLSEITGEVKNPLTRVQGSIFLIIQQVENKARSYQISIREPGPYRFQDIFPGLYTLWGFCDADSNGSYSYGSPFPYKQAERFFVFRDTIKVRSRWSNTGNDIELP